MTDDPEKIMKVHGEIVKENDRTMVLANLAKEINQEYKIASSFFRYGVSHAIKVGDLLEEARAKVGWGMWGRWVAENCDFTMRTASNYRLIAFHVHHQCINSETVSDLTIRGLLADARKTRRQLTKEDTEERSWANFKIWERERREQWKDKKKEEYDIDFREAMKYFARIEAFGRILQRTHDRALDEIFAEEEIRWCIFLHTAIVADIERLEQVFRDQLRKKGYKDIPKEWGILKPFKKPGPNDWT